MTSEKRVGPEGTVYISNKVGGWPPRVKQSGQGTEWIVPGALGVGKYMSIREDKYVVAYWQMSSAATRRF